MLVAPDLDAMAVLLRGSPDYRVLTRFRARINYTPILCAVGGLRTGLYVDCETTGLDTATDKVIELAVVPFSYDEEGHVIVAEPGFNWFDDPGVPIPPEVTALTGINDDRVRGCRIDEALVAARILDSSLVVAHNADFDRKVLERRLPLFASVPWACSYREVPWDRFGCTGGKLTHILADTCREFSDGHRALEDAHVGVHVLAEAHLEGRTALSYLLDSARLDTVRVWAIGSPFSAKPALKQRHYRWADGTTGPYKAWYKDVGPDDADAECQWLRENAFVRKPITDLLTARDRYSVRCGA